MRGAGCDRGAAVAEVGEDDLLEVDLVQLPAGVVDMAVGPYEQRRLPLGVALTNHLMNASHGRRIAARACEEAMARDDLLDRPDQLPLALGEDDQGVADPLQGGGDVRAGHR